MNDIVWILIIFSIIFILYLLTSENVEIYNDYTYFNKFKNKVLTELTSNNKIFPKQMDLTKRILILTYDNRPNLSYIKIHNENMEEYAKKWGLTYKFVNKCKYNNYWCKIRMVLKELLSDKYDYVWWMDSDTYIFNMDISIQNILQSYSSDIFVGSDNNPKFDLINAGVFIISNSKIGKQFLVDCIKSFNSKCKKSNGDLKGAWAGTCYEQGIMNILIADKYYPYTTILTNNIIFNYNKCNQNVFIMHLYASSSKDRVKCFSKF